MKHSHYLKGALGAALVALVFAMIILGSQTVNAASTYTVDLPQSGGSNAYTRDPSFALEKDSSWITIKTSSPSNFTIGASANTTGKGRIGYVYVKRQGSVVTQYKVVQPGSRTTYPNAASGSSSVYGKYSYTTLVSDASWISIYRPNSYNFRIDYSENKTGKSRTGHVYEKDGSKIISTYTIVQGSTRPCKVTLEYNGTTKYYDVAKGAQFTFPSAPSSIPDGKAFEGWIMKCSTPSFVGINKPGSTTTIYEDSYYYISYRTLYEKLGDVKDPDSGKTYSIWMVQNTSEAKTSFDKKHSGYVVKILDGKDSRKRPDYQIVNSWQFRDDTFKKGVCNLIVKYNKDQYRTDLWNRSVTSCVDEWNEHNAIYALCDFITSATPASLVDTINSAKNVDLDAVGDGYVWSEIYNALFK